LEIHFRGALCYVDAYVEPEPPSRGLLRALGETRQDYLERLRQVPLHLCRLRYFGWRKVWSVAFYTYSHERYELCTFPNGAFYGTPEEAFEVGAVYLQGRSPAPGSALPKRRRAAKRQTPAARRSRLSRSRR
jgi:hypothetical protein